MKFFFDNNLSPHLARALAALCAAEGVRVVHKSELFAPDTRDVAWIDALAQDGGWSIVTQDRLRNRLERQALRESGLTAFILAKAWSNHDRWEKAAQLIRWWPRIMKQADLVHGGAAFEVPWRARGKGQFQQL